MIDKSKRRTHSLNLGERLEFDPLLIHKISTAIGTVVGFIVAHIVIQNTEGEEVENERPAEPTE